MDLQFNSLLFTKGKYDIIKNINNNKHKPENNKGIKQKAEAPKSA